MATLRQRIEAEARKLHLSTYEFEEDRQDAANWWDSTGDDMLKEDCRKIVLDQMMDKAVNKPTEKQVLAAAQALRLYSTGACDLGKVCDLCDCWLETASEEQIAEDVAQELDIARYVLGKANDAEA